MNRTTRILVVDDEPTILEVLSDLLRAEGYEVWQASTGLKGLQLTKEKRPDLVVLDIMLPDISGMDVCRQIKTDATLPDTFVVMFSGTATSAMQKAAGLDIGADDYLIKPVNPDELLARIRMILRLRDTTVALRTSEQHYRRLVDILPDAVSLFDLNGQLTTVNAQAAAMLGYENPAELMGKNAVDVTPPEEHERMRAEMAAALQKGVLRNREFLLLRKNAERFPVELSAAALQDASGKPSGLVSVMRDITQRKQGENVLRASEERFRQLAESISEVFWIRDFTTNTLIYVSPGYEEIWGQTCASLYASPRSWADAIHPEDRERVAQAAQTKLNSGQYCEVYRILRPDGSLRWIEDRGFPIKDEAGNCYRVVGIAEDITSHKRAEEALRESEARTSAIMEAALDAIITIDHHGSVIEFNRSAEKAFGCSRGQIIGQKMSAVLIPARLRDWFDRGVADLFTSDAGPTLGSRIEMAVLRADGTEFPSEFTIARIELPGPPVFTAFIRDITLRRRAESQLITLAHAVESTSEMICITDLQNRFTFVNAAFLKAYGYAEGELLGKTPDILFSPRNPVHLMEHILQQTHLGGWHGEVIDVRKDGTEFPVWLSTSLVKDTKGRIVGLMGMAQDISERKRAEEQIRLLADAVQSTREMISITDPENRFIFVNKAFLATIGCNEAEILGKKPDFLYSPNNPPRLGEHIYEQTLSGGWNGELLNRRIDGTDFPISLSTSRINNSEGGILGLVGVARNITERKRSEKQSTAFALLGYRLSAAATPTQAANIILTIASDLFGWDSGYVHLYSEKDDKIVPILTLDTVSGKRIPIDGTTFELDPSPLMKLVMSEGARLINRADGIPDSPSLVPFGDIHRLSASMMYVPIRAGGAVLGILSIQSYTPKTYSAEDLELLQTLADHCGEAFQRIKFAEGLREAEAKYRSIFENATEGIFQMTPGGRYLSANPALARMLGYQNPEELVSSISKLEERTYVRPETSQQLKKLLEKQGTVEGFEAERYRKDGTKFWIRTNARAVRDRHGTMLYYEGTNQNVTERKRAEAVLQDSERKLRLIAENTTDVIFAFDMQRQPLYVNPAVFELTGYTFTEIQQSKFINWIHPEDHERMMKLWEGLFAGKGYSDAEFRLITKTGRAKWCSSTWGPLFDERGLQVGVQGRERDITERKLADEELRRLTGRIIDAQEVERQRVARDLHDGVNQLIASAKMRLRKVIETIPVLSPASREILGRCDQLLVQALEENRRIAHNLRPSDLDAFGLAAACRNLCEEVQTRTSLVIKCRITPSQRRWPRDIELNLFRIVQEALNNIEKHAQAKTVQLQVSLQGGAIILKIKDDGRGFSTAAAKPKRRKGHGIGLTNIRERAVSLGGTCEVKTSPEARDYHNRSSSLQEV